MDKRRFLKLISHNGISDLLFVLEKNPRNFPSLCSKQTGITDSGRKLIAILRQLFVEL